MEEIMKPDVFPDVPKGNKIITEVIIKPKKVTIKKKIKKLVKKIIKKKKK